MCNTHAYYDTTIDYFCETNHDHRQLLTTSWQNHAKLKFYWTRLYQKTFWRCPWVAAQWRQINYAVMHCQTTQVRIRTGNEGKDTAWAASWHNFQIRLKWPHKMTTYFGRNKLCLLRDHASASGIQITLFTFSSTTLSPTRTTASNDTANIPCTWLHTPRKYTQKWRLAPRILHLGRLQGCVAGFTPRPPYLPLPTG